MEAMVNGHVIELWEGDITDRDAGCIVNAANSNLVLGGGVAGAIKKVGGPQIQAECDKIASTPVGTAVITTGGNLKARYVIHAVGPRMGEGDEDAKLADATRSALELADEHHLRTIAMPAISTGIFGFPVRRCAQIMLETTIDYLQGESDLSRVTFALFSRDSYEIFEAELNELVKPVT